eukprot:2224329-Prymnesium_polylepis.1
MLHLMSAWSAPIRRAAAPTTLLLSSDGSTVFMGEAAHSAAQGKQLWNASNGSWWGGTPEISPTGDVSYVPSSGGLLALNTSSALACNHVREGRAAVASAAGDAVYVGSSANRLYAFSSADGALRWSVDVGGAVQARPTLLPTGALATRLCERRLLQCHILPALEPEGLRCVNRHDPVVDDGDHSWCGRRRLLVACAVSPDGKTVFVGSLYPAGMFAFAAADGKML